MKTKNHQIATVPGFILMVALTEAAVAGGPPQEPTEKYLVNEGVNIITGLYTRAYSPSKDSSVDYRTARQIILSEYNEYWNSVVETKEFPLYYWFDANQDGHFAMWIDLQVEGCAWDSVPYEWQATAQHATTSPIFP